MMVPTVTRSPRMHAFPPINVGSRVIRVRFFMFDLTSHPNSTGGRGRNHDEHSVAFPVAASSTHAHLERHITLGARGHHPGEVPAQLGRSDPVFARGEHGPLGAHG